MGHEPAVLRAGLARRRPAATRNASGPTTCATSTRSSTGCAPRTRGVDFESCAGGGGRVDLGILRRVEQVWTSDNTDAWDRVKIQEGFTQAYPAAGHDGLGDRQPQLPDRPASCRSASGSTWRWPGRSASAATCCAGPTRSSPRRRELIAVYKEIRPVDPARRACTGSPRPAPTPSVPASTCPPTGRRSLCCAGGGLASSADGCSGCGCAGLDPDARYTDADTGAEHLGAALMNVGLDQPGGSEFGSALIRMRRS